MHPTPRYRSARVVLTSTVLCGALVASGGAAAQADDHRPGRVPAAGDQRVLADGLVGPLSLSVGNHRTVYVSQNFAGTIDAVHEGEVTPSVTSPAPEVEVGAVSALGNRLYYVTSAGAGDPAGNFDAHLKLRDARGDVEEIADLGKHERDHNPDAGTTYGFVGLPDDCEIPEGIPVSYTGILDSHPYATDLWHGTVFVADAGGNDVLAVDRDGHVSTVAVLPPAPLEITAEIAAGFGLPPCAAGATYLFESVPTDVEVGQDGWLYVTSLPGGPEVPGLSLGAVFKVDPESGAVELVTRGFSGATNLAVGVKGEIYVTELFGGKVSVIPRGSTTPQTFLEVPLPAAVDVDGKSLYVTTEALPGEGAPPSGKLIEVELDY